MKKNKKIIFDGVFLALIFGLTLYGVFHGEDLGTMLDAIQTADWRWLLLGLALVVFFIWCESIIIWYMMRSYGIHIKEKICFLFCYALIRQYRNLLHLRHCKGKKLGFDLEGQSLFLLQ